VENKSYRGDKTLKSDFECIYDWLAGNSKHVPELELISATLRDKVNILQPNASSRMYDVKKEPYKDGRMKVMFVPSEPYYNDIDIICYRTVYEDDVTRNMRQLSKMQNVCDWFVSQQNMNNVPPLEANECYKIECLTPTPFIRNTYEDEENRIIVDYAITVRFYIKNPARQSIHVL
jgi:hypothetical protein